MLSFQNERYPYSKLLEDAARWRIGGGTYLLVFEAQQEDFFHHGELRLFVAFSTLANVSRIVGNLVAILAVLVARLGGAVADIVGRVGSRRVPVSLAVQAAPASATTSR
jgi:hypothetical protein